jgi:hypothetical protein
MIAKSVQRKKGTSDFRRLANYILDTGHGGEKVEWSRVTNCVSEDAEWAIREIQATQTKNTRSQADKTYHLVVSFPAGERPSREQLEDIEDHMAAALGFSEHQRLSAVHTDTDYVHLHLAINKVHPRTLRCVTPRRDFYLLDAACRELEQRHGLEQDNRIGEKRGASRAAGMEAHGGEQSLLGWIRENAGEALLELRSGAASWQEAHRVLGRYGLELAVRGAGLVVRDTKSGVAVRASQVDWQLSAKALTERWGAYEPPEQGGSRKRPEAQRSYQKGPVHRHPDSARLYAEYQREREAKLEARKAAQAAAREEQRQHEARLRVWYAERRALVRRGYAGPLERRAEYSRLSRERREDLAKHRQAAAERRGSIAREQAAPTWQEWLRRQAEQGNAQALEVLRSREQRQRRLSNALELASSAEEARHVVLKHLRPRVRKGGDVLYELADGSCVRDRKEQIAVEKPTAAALFLALLIAQERFGDRALVIEGTEEFKRQAAQVAGMRGVGVRFSDAALDALREGTVRAQRALSAPSALEAFLESRNRSREKVSSILAHRAWTAEDRGAAVYRGRRQLADGSKAVLLERGGEMLVKVVNPAVPGAESTHWRTGQTVHLDARGHSVEAPSRSEQGRGR